MDYSPSLALALARSSKLAYERSSIVGDKTDTQIWVEDQPGCRVFSFRGTQASSAKDWLTDLDAPLVRLDETSATVHQGFLRASDEVIDAVASMCQPKPDTINIFTGHSLGGALAHLVSARLALRGIQVSCVYTYGSPRVGGWNWYSLYQEMLGEKTFRVKHRGDLVPCLPWILGFYRHVGCEKLIGERTWFSGLREHHIEKYISDLGMFGSKAFNEDRTKVLPD
jgi:Lipase (class 3)